MNLPKFPPLSPLQKCCKWYVKLIGIPVFYGGILLKWFFEEIFLIVLIVGLLNYFFMNPKSDRECLPGMTAQGTLCVKGKLTTTKGYLMKELSK